MDADLTPKHKPTNKKAGILNNRSRVPRIHIALKCNICPPYEGIPNPLPATGGLRPPLGSPDPTLRRCLPVMAHTYSPPPLPQTGTPSHDTRSQTHSLVSALPFQPPSTLYRLPSSRLATV